jgi:hypothetical protein
MEPHVVAIHRQYTDNTAAYFDLLTSENMQSVNGPFFNYAYNSVLWRAARAEALLAGHEAATVSRRIIKLNQRMLKWQRIHRRAHKMVLEAHMQVIQANMMVIKRTKNKRRAAMRANNIMIEIMELSQGSERHPMSNLML